MRGKECADEGLGRGEREKMRERIGESDAVRIKHLDKRDSRRKNGDVI